MTPELAFMLIKLLVEQGPKVYAQARKILSKKDPTDADFDELDTILEKSGRSYFTVPNGTPTRTQ